MTQILSVDTHPTSNPLKIGYRKFRHLDVFWQRALVGMLLILVATPIIVSNRFDVRQRAAGGNSITPANLRLHATFNSIGVEVPFQGDDNANATASLQFRKQGETEWHDTLPLWRTDGSADITARLPEKPASRQFALLPKAQAQTSGTTLTITASGQSNSNGVPASMDLYIDNQFVQSFSSVGGNIYSDNGFQTFTYTSPAQISANQVKIVYNASGAGNGSLRVDKIAINGTVYESEATTTYSTGVYDSASGGCLAGFRGNENLVCDQGYFVYGQTTAPTSAPTITQTPTSIAAPTSSNATSTPAPTGSSVSTLTRAFYGSALNLQAGIVYEIQVTVTDSDGGTQTLTGQVTTRTDAIPAASSLTPSHFVRADGSDNNSGTADSPTGAWKTIYKAMTAAPAGATVQVGPGYYASPNASNKDLVRNSPIILKAQYPALDDARTVSNAGKRSVIDYGIQTSPTGSTQPNAGMWQQVSITGATTGQSRTLWKWTGPVSSSYPVVDIGYAPTREAAPKRLAYWDRKSGTATDKSGKVWNLGTVEGWADVLYTNMNYRYGFASFGADVYLRLPGDINPNSQYVSLTPTAGNGNVGFMLNGANSRLSGFEIRSVGVELHAGASASVVDHNYFVSSGVTIIGNKPNGYGSDMVIQYNRIVDSSLWSDNPTTQPEIPWCFIKCGLTLEDGTSTSWNRVGARAESTGIGSNGGARNTVIRYNTIDGPFNGIGGYNAGFDRYAEYNYDIHDNLIARIADDAFEPEQVAINWRMWNNRMENVLVVLSTGPVMYGPLYFYNNTTWKQGAHGLTPSLTGTIDGGPVAFKYSGSGTTTKARVYVINNTFHSDTNGDGAGQYAGGGANTEKFYLRNNIFRQMRYAFQAPGNTSGTSAKWDEDFNYFYTGDMSRGINYNSSNQASVAQYRTNSGQGANTNIDDTAGNFHTIPDSWFVNAAAGDLDLRIDAPLRTRGIAVPNIVENTPVMLGSGITFSSNPTIPTPSGVSPSAVPTNTPVPTSTPSPTPTRVPTVTPTPTRIPTPTPTSVVIPTTQPTSTPTPTSTFIGYYFNNANFAGTPVLTRTDQSIAFNWGYSSPNNSISANNFTVRWFKEEYFTGGNYTFTARHDDGMRVYVDGALIYNSWKNGSAKTKTFTKSISQGNHTIRVDYYEARGRAEVSLSYKRQ